MLIKVEYLHHIEVKTCKNTTSVQSRYSIFVKLLGGLQPTFNVAHANNGQQFERSFLGVPLHFRRVYYMLAESCPDMVRAGQGCNMCNRCM